MIESVQFIPSFCSLGIASSISSSPEELDDHCVTELCVLVLIKRHVGSGNEIDYTSENSRNMRSKGHFFCNIFESCGYLYFSNISCFNPFILSISKT